MKRRGGRHRLRPPGLAYQLGGEVCGCRRPTAFGESAVYAGREEPSLRGVRLITEREVQNLTGRSGCRQAILAVDGEELPWRPARLRDQVCTIDRGSRHIKKSDLHANRRDVLSLRRKNASCRGDDARR